MLILNIIVSLAYSGGGGKCPMLFKSLPKGFLRTLDLSKPRKHNQHIKNLGSTEIQPQISTTSGELITACSVSVAAFGGAQYMSVVSITSLFSSASQTQHSIAAPEFELQKQFTHRKSALSVHCTD